MRLQTRISGPIASTVPWRMFLIFRTRWRSTSPVSSSRHYRPPRPCVPPTAQRTISPLTTSICVLIRSTSPRESTHRRWLCSRMRLHAMRIMDRRLLGPRFAVCSLSPMAPAQIRKQTKQKGIDFARRALAGARNDPGAVTNAAMALACFGEDIDAMMALVDRALAVNPSYAGGWHVSGFLRLWAGQPRLAIEHAEVALRLSP